MDADLRNGLWSVLFETYLGKFRDYHNEPAPAYWAWEQRLVVGLWRDFYKLAVDSIPHSWPIAVEQMRNWFFQAEWHQVYDFLEFIAAHAAAAGFGEEDTREFPKACNAILQREASGYRFLAGFIQPITDETEMSGVEEATLSSDPYGPVGTHLRSALAFLSDRDSPDYRNSIKESISAVEALCRIVAGEKATLGDALRLVQRKVGLHPALRRAFDQLYGYTSDEGGVRR